MGTEKKQRLPYFRYGAAEHVQALTGASTATAVLPYGISTITVTTGEGTAANLVYTLTAPEQKGLRKVIVADLNSTKEVSVRTPSSGDTFYGSTKNSIAWSTGSTALPGYIELVAVSSQQWAVASIGSTSITVAGATA
jgi:hypothetical protein